MQEHQFNSWVGKMGLLMCTGASLSQDEFHRRRLWVTDITYYGVAPPPFLASKELSVGKIFLTLKMRNMWSLISYLGKAQPPLLMVLLLLFWSFGAWIFHREETPSAYPGGGGHLLPASVTLGRGVHEGFIPRCTGWWFDFHMLWNEYHSTFS